MKKIIFSGTVLSILTLSATIALAMVTFDPITGTGFVGKGDLQTPWGWNNQMAQTELKKNVSFDYVESAFYDVTCEWETVTGGPHSQTILHDVTLVRHTGVNGSVAYDVRTHKQIDGINLTGYNSLTTVGSVPAVGDSCPQAHATAVVTEVAQTSSSVALNASDVSAGTGPTQIWP